MVQSIENARLFTPADDRRCDFDSVSYYFDGNKSSYKRTRTYSESNVYTYKPSSIRRPPFEGVRYLRPRRYSVVEKSVSCPRRFLIDIDETIRALLHQEDTDNDAKITVEDKGGKSFALPSANSNGFNMYDVRGTYMLSCLLQELSLARGYHDVHDGTPTPPSPTDSV